MTEVSDIVTRMKEHGACVVIPTYNNASTLARVVGDVEVYCSDIIVVDDGSTDDTHAVLDSLGTRIAVVRHERNRGKGAAIKTGVREAQRRGFRYVVTIDSDGQHKASDLPMLLTESELYPDAIVTGSRGFNHDNMPGGNKFANRFSNFWFRLQTGVNLSDTQTGYRLYPIDRLHGLRLLTSRYEAELEILVFAAWHGERIREVPVNVYYPPREERVSHFRPGRDFARISVLNTMLCFLAVVYALPMRLIRLLKR